MICVTRSETSHGLRRSMAGFRVKLQKMRLKTRDNETVMPAKRVFGKNNRPTARTIHTAPALPIVLTATIACRNISESVASRIFSKIAISQSFNTINLCKIHRFAFWHRRLSAKTGCRPHKPLSFKQKGYDKLMNRFGADAFHDGAHQNRTATSAAKRPYCVQKSIRVLLPLTTKQKTKRQKRTKHFWHALCFMTVDDEIGFDLIEQLTGKQTGEVK